MYRLLLIILSFIFISTGYAEDVQIGDSQSEDKEEGIQMIIPDGQFMSEPIEIFINKDITKAMKPKLILIDVSLFSSKKKGEETKLSPQVIAGKQKKIVNNVDSTGTILLFNLHQYPFKPYEILNQVKPVLVWNNPDDPEQPYRAVGSQTNIGNNIPFIIFILIIIGFCVSVIAIWSKRAEKSALSLLLGNDGYLSLSRTQVAAWTIVVGGVVFGFGLLMLNVPNIPASLVVLMGLSLATGGIKNYPFLNYKPKNVKPKFSLADMICDNDSDTDTKNPSLPKAQMLFWTFLMLFLFVVKSVKDGIIWEVPWEMVALMGMSQAAYLSPQLPGVQQKESVETTTSADNPDSGGNK